MVVRARMVKCLISLWYFGDLFIIFLSLQQISCHIRWLRSSRSVSEVLKSGVNLRRAAKSHCRLSRQRLWDFCYGDDLIPHNVFGSGVSWTTHDFLLLTGFEFPAKCTAVFVKSSEDFFAALQSFSLIRGVIELLSLFWWSKNSFWAK